MSEVKAAAREKYSWKNVRDRYDADLLMAGFEDGAAWAADRSGVERDALVKDLREEIAGLKRSNESSELSRKHESKRADAAEAKVARVQALIDREVERVESSVEPFVAPAWITVRDLRAALAGGSS